MATIKPQKVKTGNGRAIIGAIASIAMFGSMIFGIYKVYEMDQREVEVVKFSRDIGIGTEITQADIVMGTILTAEYKDKEDTVWTANDGTQKQGQIYIRWEDCQSILGMYVTNARRVDDAVTLRDLSDEEIEPNPWFSEVPVGNELYTMKFSANDTYTRMIMPGCTMRVRIVQMVDQSEADAFRAQIAKKEATNKNGIEKDSNGYVSAVLPYYSVDTNAEGVSVGNKKQVPIAEVIFENLVMLDALNNSGESIFDIYYAMVNMDSTVREQFIRENADSLKTRLLPTSLIMSLTPEQSTAIAEFEKADVIVCISPSYWADIPGQFKAFIDRCTPWCNTHEPHAALSSGKRGYTIALRTGPSMKECERIIGSIEHFYGHLEIECCGSMGLCSIEYREEVADRQDEILKFCESIK